MPLMNAIVPCCPPEGEPIAASKAGWVNATCNAGVDAADHCAATSLQMTLQMTLQAAFVAALKGAAHVLNEECNEGADLLWLRGQRYVVTACDGDLTAAKVASRRAGQPVRVGTIGQLRCVVAYDGIWLSRPLNAEPVALVAQLRGLIPLLKPGAPVCFTLLPTLAQMQKVPQLSGLSSLPQDHSHDAPLAEWLRQLICDAALPLEIDMVGQGGIMVKRHL
ncbi:MAG: hypothetical protein ACRC5V_03975 [Aeromonas sp.]